MTEGITFENSSESKRRKVRKGTQSCWECRRRKVRCIFTVPTNPICNNCTRRGTPCISQELYGDYAPASPVINSTAHALRVLAPAPARLDRELKRELIAAWPSQDVLNIIYTLPVGLSAHLHSGGWKLYSSSAEQNPPSPQHILRLPSPSSHPILIARKLLVLGTYLQGVPPSAIQNLEARGLSLRQLMHRVVDTAIRLVTTKDELIGSVEAIGCIMMEARYQNYAGNLHRAWMAARRAISVAQMMALHRGFNSPLLKILEPETRATIDLDHLSFRLAEADAYLSLMLGLSRASLETRHFTSPRALERCDPMERMERIHYVAYERVLQRTDSDINNLAETHEIDKLLQKAAAEMPPQWWLTPTFKSDNSDGTKTWCDTARIMDQFSHYHLLIRLHLPYILRSSLDHRYDYSKITAVNASRELLTRYLSFHSTNPAQYYCRGSDFLIFIAATVLCVAHIQCDGPAEDTVFKLLAHSRQIDRGLMERTLQVVEAMNASGTDAIASKISRILGDLLVVEADAANVICYSTDSSKISDEDLECGGKLINGGKALQVHIPCFGSIKFERGAISKTADAIDVVAPPAQDVPRSECSSNQIPYVPGPMDGSELLQHTLPAQPIDDFIWPEEGDWGLQGVDIALFDSLFRGSAIPEHLQDECWTQWPGGN
ncbi:hypothetical protein CC80DRAFT_412943 [Byssothecium circinans]|uniref:Zn(2)-C6 fungal-type domain-containing protein n=1 Tax=Byssothecium circinans TaxID=147558 RepID=A0A6A5U6S9_9PLEO|nr:hypothetical protein CC80DRAFT_412943 [Byssothecium circinans]